MNKPSMEEFVSENDALKRPVLGRPYKGASLQEMKAAAQKLGGDIIDQSAGDISLVGEDLDPAFKDYRRDIGKLVGIESDAKSLGMYDLPQNYAAEYPKVLQLIAENGLGITAPFEGMSTVSGRAAINSFLTSVKQRSESIDINEGKKQATLIVDPLTWSGYQDSAKEIGIQLVYSPISDGHGLMQSPDGVLEAMNFVKQNSSLRLMGINTIQPSNPTGLGSSVETLKKIAEICAENNIFFNIDAFYSVIARDGVNILGIQELQKLPPEVLAKISILVGETKATDSQKKTASMFWFAPQGYESTAKSYMAGVRKSKGNWNAYARPDEAITAAALWSYPLGIHAAMGKRYSAINSARNLMDEQLSSQIPFQIGDSFYGTGALVGPDGQPLVRDKDGKPVSETQAAMKILANEHKLMVAPGEMFRPEGANLLARFTAASTEKEILRVGDVIRKLLEQSNG